jgi:hypothetical protein
MVPRFGHRQIIRPTSTSTLESTNYLSVSAVILSTNMAGITASTFTPGTHFSTLRNNVSRPRSPPDGTMT